MGVCSSNTSKSNSRNQQQREFTICEYQQTPQLQSEQPGGSPTKNTAPQQQTEMLMLTRVQQNQQQLTAQPYEVIQFQQQETVKVQPGEPIRETHKFQQRELAPYEQQLPRQIDDAAMVQELALLHLKLAPMNPVLQFPNNSTAVLLELQANTNENRLCRSPLEIVLLVNIGGRFDTIESKSIRKSLQVISEMLSPQDRVSVVGFDQKSEVILDWQPAGNKICMLIQSYIDSRQIQQVSTGLNLNLGLEKGLIQLSKYNRLGPETVKSLFIFSEGNIQSQSVEQLINTIRQFEPNTAYTINAFGYGAEHSPEILSQLARFRFGSFRYINQNTAIEKYFLGTIVGFMSIFLNNITMKVFIEGPGKIVSCLQSCWTVTSPQQSECLLQQVIPGVKYRYIFNIQLLEPVAQIKLCCELQGNYIETCQLITKDCEAIVKSQKQKPEAGMDIEVYQLFQTLTAAEAVEQAKALIFVKNYDEARQAIESQLLDLSNLRSFNQNDKNYRKLKKIKEKIQNHDSDVMAEICEYQVLKSQQDLRSLDDWQSLNTQQNRVIRAYERGEIQFSIESCASGGQIRGELNLPAQKYVLKG